MRDFIRKCPNCGNLEVTRLFRGQDMLHHVSDEYFHVVRCTRHGCNLTFVQDPPMDVEKYYPLDYIAHKAGLCNQQAEVRPCIKGLLISSGPLSKSVKRLRATVRSRRRRALEGILWGKQQRLAIGFSKGSPLGFSSNGRLIDVGCGVGKFLLGQRNLGWDVYGIEPSKHAVSQCHKNGLDRVICGYLPDMADKFYEYFDAVTLNQVLEHVRFPVPLMNGVFKVLKPMGLLIMNFPVYERSIFASLFKRYWFGLDVPRHIFFYNEESVRSLLERCNLEIAATYRFSSTSGLLGSIERMIRAALSNNIPTDSIRKNRILCFMARPVIRIFDWIGRGDNLWVIARKRV